MDIKNFKPSPAMISLAESVFLAMAHESYVRPIVEEYRERALADMGRPDLKLKDRYFWPDEQFQNWYQRKKVYQNKSGLKVRNEGNCPLLEAESLVRQAQRALVDVMEEVTGLSADRLICAGLDKYNRYVDLTLRTLAPFVRNSDAILMEILGPPRCPLNQVANKA